MNRFMRAKEVGELLQCSECMAYKVIAKLNKELQDKGYITISGRISKSYLYERMGIKDEYKREATRSNQSQHEIN